METKPRLNDPKPSFGKVTGALILLGACLLTYANSFHNGFLMDDLPNLIENAEIGSVSFLHLDIRSLQAQAYFRPGTHILNLITFSWFGTNPAGYHLINLMLLYLAALTLWALTETWLPDRTAALLPALFFCVHPINGVLVNYKNATAFPFLIFAMNLSMLHLLAAAGTQEKRGHQLLGVLWFLAALLCHELVVLYPLYILAVLIIVQQRPPLKALKGCLPVVVVLCLYLVFRSALAMPSLKTDASFFPGLTPLTYAAALARLICWYLSNLIIPRTIVLAWDTPLDSPHPWLWASLLALFVLSLLFLIKKQQPRPVRLAAAWILIGLLPLPAAAFSRPLLGFVVEPHWLVYSSIGFLGLLGFLISRARERLPAIAGHSLLAGLVFFYLAASWVFNHRWSSEKRYCQYWLSVSPDNFMPNYWMGHALLEEKSYEKARDHFEKVLGMGHRYYEVLGSLGYLEQQLGHDPAALSYFQESLSLNPRHADTYYYLGLSYQRLGQQELAEKSFRAALAREPRHGDAQRALQQLPLKTVPPTTDLKH